LSSANPTPEEGRDDPTLRLYAIVRGDLFMPPGKLAAQAGHAFLDAYLASLDARPACAHAYRADGHGTKIALRAHSLDDLLSAESMARRAGIPAALVTDSGHILPPHFDGSPIVTALGLGPAKRSEVRRITRRFALVP
jgi:peptidyl-tRNA hydrolase